MIFICRIKFNTLGYVGDYIKYVIESQQTAFRGEEMKYMPFMIVCMFWTH